jgi:hypothetical protein
MELKHRLTIAIFENAERFWTALLALLESGQPIEGIAVAALAETLLRFSTRAQLSGPERKRVANILAPSEEVSLGANGALVRVTKGILAQGLGSVIAKNAKPARRIRWSSPSWRTEMAAHLQSGALVLCADSASAEQQRTNVRILLRYSRSEVQTHEFSAPA